MLSRILIALPIIPILVMIFLKGNFTFLIFVEIISVMSLYEFYNMVFKKKKMTYIGLILGAMIPILTYYRYDVQNLLAFIGIQNNAGTKFEIGTFIVFAFFVLVIKQLLNNEIENSLIPLTLTLFGIIYIPYILSHLILIKSLISGNAIVLYTFLSIWACDTGAYFIGILFGKKVFKKPLAKEISPNKSIEGSIGGFLAVYLLTYYYRYVILLFNKIFSFFKLSTIDYTNQIFNINNYKIFILALLIFIFASIGDLVESKFKREFKIKDSSNLLLGHGGFLDRFDSALFVIPVVYYFIKLFVI